MAVITDLLQLPCCGTVKRLSARLEGALERDAPARMSHLGWPAGIQLAQILLDQGEE